MSEALLPSAADLLRAVRHMKLISHPLARWAIELAELHTVEHAVLDAPISIHRLDVVQAMDDWINRHVPQHRHGAALHTETLGCVVDRLTAACVHADCAVARYSPGDPTVQAAWCKLAEIVDAYTDLIAEVQTGRRRLPTFTVLH